MPASVQMPARRPTRRTAGARDGARRWDAHLTLARGRRLRSRATLCLARMPNRGMRPAVAAVVRIRRTHTDMQKEASLPHADPHERAGSRWRIARAPGASPGWVDWVPNERLRVPSTAGEGEHWEAADGQACFVLDKRALGAPLAAGWYELRGWLQAEADGVVLPSLCLRYAGRETADLVEWMLPQPDRRGRVDTLLMVFEDVEALGFFPGVGAARFGMRDFSLRRVSRMRALCKMLSGDGWLACCRRALAWRQGLGRHGLKRATDALYADYRRRMQPRGFSEYGSWVRRYDTLDDARLDALRQNACALAGSGPQVSILLHVCDPPAPQLQRCLDRLLAQVWERWELWVFLDAAASPVVRTMLAEYAARDTRIRIAVAERDDGEAALAKAQGGFVVVLDATVALRRHALLRVAEAVAADPELAIVYADEDEIDAGGKRSRHAFKPDWNPDLLRSRNYIGCFAAVRARLVRDAGGIRIEFGDSVVYDLVLRCSERVAAQRIRHVPEVLCHTQAVPDAPGVTRDPAKPDAAARAVAEHLQRIGSAATVDVTGMPSGTRRVRWPLPQPAPRISLIIPTRDRVALLRQCVESILARSTYPDLELVVVDNQSRERSALQYLAQLATRGRVRVLRYDAPFNYSALNNWAARQCSGQLLALVNNDIEVITPDWLEEMAGLALRPDTGAVGAMLYYPDDTIQHAGMLLGVHGVAGHAHVGKPRGYCGYQWRACVTQALSAVTGACLMVRRDVFDEAGGLDESLPVEFNDVDFCLRLLKRGYRNAWTPFAELYHHESASRRIDDAAAKESRAAGIARMRERWGERLYNDPSYNPNLTLQGTDFALAFPPRRFATHVPRA